MAQLGGIRKILTDNNLKEKPPAPSTKQRSEINQVCGSTSKGQGKAARVCIFLLTYSPGDYVTVYVRF
jgi:hypothetical protein